MHLTVLMAIDAGKLHECPNVLNQPSDQVFNTNMLKDEKTVNSKAWDSNKSEQNDLGVRFLRISLLRIDGVSLLIRRCTPAPGASVLNQLRRIPQPVISFFGRTTAIGKRPTPKASSGIFYIKDRSGTF